LAPAAESPRLLFVPVIGVRRQEPIEYDWFLVVASFQSFHAMRAMHAMHAMQPNSGGCNDETMQRHDAPGSRAKIERESLRAP
jgi:hypothetical protein